MIRQGGDTVHLPLVLPLTPHTPATPKSSGSSAAQSVHCSHFPTHCRVPFIFCHGDSTMESPRELCTLPIWGLNRYRGCLAGVTALGSRSWEPRPCEGCTRILQSTHHRPHTGSLQNIAQWDAAHQSLPQTLCAPGCQSPYLLPTALVHPSTAPAQLHSLYFLLG